MRGKRTKVAKGIYRDAYGYSVVFRSGGKPIEKRYPLDTPIETLTRIRERERSRAPRLVQPGSFVRDAVRFLAGRRALASFKSDRAHLRPWIHRFVTRSRFAITPELVREALADWQLAGYRPREIRHRWRILSQFFDSFDDEDTPNPCRKVKPPKIQKTRPRSVSAELIREVAVNLRIQESDGIGRLRDAKTRARFLVLATTGQRPAQLRRAVPADVDLDRRVWFVDPAKGDNGAVIYLNEDMLAAWQLFVAARAWGHFDGRSFVKTLQRNGWPKGIRPYNLRHTVGLTLSELGVDLGDIQAHMGHASPATTRQFYVPGVPARLMLASQKLDGRMAVAAGALPRSGSMNGIEQDAKDRKKTRDPRPTPIRADIAHRAGKHSRSA
jgi:integrase